MSTIPSPPADRSAARIALDRATLGLLIFLATLTAIRIAGLVAAPVNLHGDEAQYWVWSRTLDWGYFSKPPLVAWAIAATTAVFGNAEWAVRLAAPLAHAFGAFMLYLLGRRMYGVEAGLWAGIGWSIMPGVWLSASVISTDAMMLPSIALALYAAWRLSETGSLRHAALLGFAGGIGFLAKYGMSFFFLGLALAAILTPSLRRALLSRAGLLAAAIAAAVIAPNLIWNALNDFATVGHTAQNANLQSELFNPDELGQFFVDQLGVFGPILFVALMALFVGAAIGRWRPNERERFLIAFVVPPLLIIAAQALLSRAHANWAAAAYPAAMVLVSAMLAQGWRRWALWTTAAVHVGVGALFLAIVLSPSFAERVGAGEWLKRARGWDDIAGSISALNTVADQPYTAIMVDHRMSYNAMRYYLRDDPAAELLRMWRLQELPGNEAEANAPMTPDVGQHVLVASTVPQYERLLDRDFVRLVKFAQTDVPVGGDEVRRVIFYEGEGFAPAPRNMAFRVLLEEARAAGARPDAQAQALR